MSTKEPPMSGIVGLSREEARSLIQTLIPLRGWRIPRSPGKNSRALLVEDVIEALGGVAGDTGSLDELVPDRDGGSDFVSSGPEDPDALKPFEAIEDRDEVDSYLRGLSPTEAEVITIRFGLRTRSPKTVIQTAKALNLTVFAVETAERNALAKMRRVAGVGTPAPNPYNRSTLNGQAA